MLNVTTCTQVIQAGEQLIRLLSSGNPAYEADPTLAQGYLALIIRVQPHGRVAGAGEFLGSVDQRLGRGRILAAAQKVDCDLEASNMVLAIFQGLRA